METEAEESGVDHHRLYDAERVLGQTASQPRQVRACARTPRQRVEHGFVLMAGDPAPLRGGAARLQWTIGAVPRRPVIPRPGLEIGREACRERGVRFG